MMTNNVKQMPRSIVVRGVPDSVRELREKTKYLKELTGTVQQFLTALDELMEKPVTLERGRMIAQLTNQLDLANQTAVRFGLGVRKRAQR